VNLICGINPVLEALNVGHRHFDRVLIVKGIRNRRVSEVIGRASQGGIPMRFEARETLDRMAGGVPHQGVIAVVSAKPTIGLEELIEHTQDPALLVLLDGVEDPRNLGAILRTTEAAGADGVLLPDRHSAGLSDTVNRASAGALEHVKVARVGNVVQALETLKGRGLWIVGLDASGSERWDQVDLRRPLVLVLGGEGRGIRRLVREHCDHIAALPLFGHVNSLNVSVAAGIALYEVIRQRGRLPSQARPIPLPTAVPRSQIVGPSQGDAEIDPGLPRVLGPPKEEEEAIEPSDDVRIDEEGGWMGSAGARVDAPNHRDWRGGDRVLSGGTSRGPEGARPSRFRRRRRRNGSGPSLGGPPSPGAPSPPPPTGVGEGRPAHRRRRRRRHRR